MNGLPANVQAIILAHPWFRSLLVPVSSYVESCKQVGKKGTPLHLYATKAKEV